MHVHFREHILYDLLSKDAVPYLSTPVQKYGRILISVALYIDKCSTDLKLLISFQSKIVFSSHDRTVLSGAYKKYWFMLWVCLSLSKEIHYTAVFSFCSMRLR